MSLPHERFNRHMGLFAGMPFDPQGALLSADEFARRRAEFLPTEQDYAYVQSLMKPVYEPGQFASWIAPPRKGINNLPQEFEYVKFARNGGR
jgi:benzoyl-CoA 2,3-dioxygenase component B